MSVTLRPADSDDEDFLFRLYASTRADEMAAWGWDEAKQEMFLRQQHSIRESQYRGLYADTDHKIVVHDREAVGRILIGESENELCLIDIALMTDRRGSGIGSRLIRELQARAEKQDKPVVLSVTPDSPAARLYEKLGFAVTASDALYVRMRWEPGSSQE